MTPLDLGALFRHRGDLGAGLDRACIIRSGTVAPEVSLVWRYLLAAPLMFALAAWRGERLRYPLSDHLTFAALGLTMFSLNYLLFYYATAPVASGLLSILFTIAAIGNVVLGAIIFGVRINRRVVVGGAARRLRRRGDVLSRAWRHPVRRRRAARPRARIDGDRVVLRWQHDLDRGATAPHAGVRDDGLGHGLRHR